MLSVEICLLHEGFVWCEWCKVYWHLKLARKWSDWFTLNRADFKQTNGFVTKYLGLYIDYTGLLYKQ